MLVKDFYNKEVISINKDQTVEEATQLMIEHNVGGLPVVDDENNLVGMLTEKDILSRHKKIMPLPYIDVLGVFLYLEDPRRANEELKKSLAVKIEDLMSTPVYSVTLEDDINIPLEFMVRKGFNRIPVEQEGKLVGIITRHDLLKAVIAKEE
ncbi:CBS domain-containing protein [Anaerobranca californiensis DSM 14826]|jgi:CBS domain-containing protein|uniref:CBS domain-containing protein n=1 Tax=Anaerobranca californiensis DSM 14826 TaxID=1120989 RepID=A0A1M6RU21_9FIRM|nr:CBS domain-containing protein [Anaerobranca californiensis]SHK35953.1 CBS domain-containing protein [Anaerobranca californiensis DSM 14826]